MILSLMLVCVTTFAQGQHIVKGKITDSKGDPVIGASITLEGSTTVGSISGLTGEYEIIVPNPNSSIKFSCLGFTDLVEEIKGRAIVNVVLDEDQQLLEEVVVVGYGAMRRSDLTGSLTSVVIDEKDASRNTTLDQLMEGKAAGMQLISESSAPDAGFNIRIRGLGSFSTSTEPLYVVDGIIIGGESEAIDMTMAQDKNTANTETSTNGLAGLNPSDIASIEILKDASATAIYGSQGANGVVLITTKNATKSKPVISFSSGVSVSLKSKKLDVLSFDEYVAYLEANPGSGTRMEILNRIYKDYNGPEDRGTCVVTPMSWQDYVTRPAVSQRYNFEISGKPGGYKYRFSIGYKDTMGILKNTDSKTFSARLNIEKQFFKKLTIGSHTSVSYVDSQLTNGTSAGGRITSSTSILRSIIGTKPYASANPDDDQPELIEDDFQYGPNKWIQSFTNTSKRYRILPSVFATWQITPWLSFKSTWGGDFQTEQRFQSRSYKISEIGNTASIGDVKRFKYNWDNLLMVNKAFGKHNISGTIGHSMSRDFSSVQLIQGWYLTQAFAGRAAVNSAEPEYSHQQYVESQSSLLSFFGRAVYSYADRYVLTGTIRADGSSKFQGANKWSWFPSFAFAWRITQEPWFDVPVISNAKIRLGWGAVGNQKIPNYQTRQTYSYNYYGNHYGDVSNYVIGFYPTNVNNPDLKWESSQQYNAGLDFSMWQGRFALTVDGYLKDTKDLLQARVLPSSSGFTSMYVNSGSIRNTGVEIAIDAVPVNYAGFEWRVGGNISFNRNIITSVGAEGSSAEIYLTPQEKSTVNYFTGSSLSSTSTEPLNMFIEGQPMGLFYGYLVDGVLKENETAPFRDGTTRGEGYLKYRDIDGDGLLTSADRTIIGNPNPDFTYGFNTSMYYRGFSLRVSFVGSYGADIYNLNNVFDYYTNSVSNIRAKAFYQAYDREKNPDGVMPMIGGYDSSEQIMNSSFYVEDGSFLNLKDISLSYDVPIKKQSKIIRALSLTASVNNVALWTHYSGWSPKNASTKIKRMGVELNSYPEARTFGFDIKLTF